MKVFVINLDRSPERLARVQARLDALGVPFERVAGVDEAALDPAERKRSVSGFLWWCCSLRPITRGQVGCTLGHQKVYWKMLAEGLGHACVLEDDVVLGDRFPEVLAWLDGAVDDGRPQVALLFDHSGGRFELPEGDGPCRLDRIGGSMYAEGYVLTAKAARAVLDANFPLRVLDDIWMRWVRQGRIELFFARPAVCTQTSPQDGASTIASAVVLRHEMSRLGRFWWDLRRLVGLCVDACTGWPEFKGVLALLRERARR